MAQSRYLCLWLSCQDGEPPTEAGDPGSSIEERLSSKRPLALAMRKVVVELFAGSFKSSMLPRFFPRKANYAASSRKGCARHRKWGLKQCFKLYAHLQPSRLFDKSQVLLSEAQKSRGNRDCRTGEGLTCMAMSLDPQIVSASGFEQRFQFSFYMGTSWNKLI